MLRAGGILLAAAIAAASGFGALFGSLWGFGLKCDDSCSTLPPWRNDRDAWQWDALGTVAVVGFACSLFVVAALVLRRRRSGLASLAVWVVLSRRRC
jgi:hypothetical protein